MHALRLSSFLNRPTLLSLETLLLIGPYLINTGRFLDASTLFGLVIRVAQGMGCRFWTPLLPNPDSDPSSCSTSPTGPSRTSAPTPRTDYSSDTVVVDPPSRPVLQYEPRSTARHLRSGRLPPSNRAFLFHHPQTLLQLPLQLHSPCPPDSRHRRFDEYQD